MSDYNRTVLNTLSSSTCFKSFEFSKNQLRNHSYKSPQQYLEYFWDFYEQERRKYIDGEKSYEGNLRQWLNNQNGTTFEIIMGFLLDREGVEMVSHDQRYGEVKFVKPDFVLKIKEQLVMLSCKTSLQERWKQADWEAIKFKQVYPDSLCLIIVNRQPDASNLRKKIPYLDLDGCYFGQSSEINDMFELLKG